MLWRSQFIGDSSEKVTVLAMRCVVEKSVHRRQQREGNSPGDEMYCGEVSSSETAARR